jgi:prepilin-type N-terminal cleavage/methylation domain-containing protein
MLKPRSTNQAGFTLVEVMMAATILVVGFIGLIQAVKVSSTMMDTARRQTLAAQILNHEIEKLRFYTWPQIQSLANAGPAPYSDPQFNTAIAASGATFSLARTLTNPDPAAGLREVKFTLTWIVKTSRHDSSGALLTFTYTRSNSAYFGKYGLNLTYQRS